LALTEALTDYQGAVAARTEFLNDNAENELLEDTAVIQGLGEDEEPTAAQVATAIEQADTAADEAVTTAENNLQDAQDTLDVARATQFQSYAGEVNSVTAAVTELDAMSETTLMRDATLENARVEAQSDVDADEGVYAVDGTALAEGTEELTAVYKVADGDVVSNTSLSAGELITADFVGTAQKSTITFNAALTASEEVSFDLNGTTYSATAASGILSADGFALPAEYTLTVTSASELTIDGPVATDFVVDNVTNTGAQTTIVAAPEEAMTAAEIIADADTALVGHTDGVVAVNTPTDYDATAVNFGDATVTEGTLLGNADSAEFDASIYSAAELQQNIVDAQAEVDSFVATNGDNAALLADLRTAINNFLAAEGDPSETLNGQTVTQVRDEIAGVLDADEVDEEAVDTLVTKYNAYALTEAEADEPTAVEAAIQDALATIEDRNDLDDAVTAAEGSFDNTAVGGILNTILALQEERQELVDTISTREDELTAAQDLAAQTQDLVDQLEVLDTNIEEALATLQNSEEDGGFGVTLGEFDTDATAESDLYVFADDEGSTITIANFGAEGEDRLFFGEGYTLVQLGEGETINSRVGSASELEIFWSEDDNGLTLFVEAEAEAGRDQNDAAITTIELAGLSADDIDFTGGVFSAGTVEVA
jgi:hypothetical protein